MSEVKRIQDQLRRSFEGPAWHGPSIKELVAGVTAEQATAKPLAEAHSIWEIVLHIAAWEEAALRRLAGDRAELSTEEDWPPVPDTSEAAWREALELIERNHLRLRGAIAGLDDSRLPEPVVDGMSSVYGTLHGVIQHNLYHAGQIALLKKA
ncbi:MAG: DinB family protein [Acidobacteria bacterium]|nr:DinB family protein [Acidobacteriota bacterium]